MKTKRTIFFGFFAVLVALAFTACPEPSQPPPDPTTITYSIFQIGGIDGTADTTGITFTFSGDVTGLTASDIAVTNGTGTVTKGSLSGSGTSWSLDVTVTTSGNIIISINKVGIEAGSKLMVIDTEKRRI